jgi:hypothetical protein
MSTSTAASSISMHCVGILPNDVFTIIYLKRNSNAACSRLSSLLYGSLYNSSLLYRTVIPRPKLILCALLSVYEISLKRYRSNDRFVHAPVMTSADCRHIFSFHCHRNQYDYLISAGCWRVLVRSICSRAVLNRKLCLGSTIITWSAGFHRVHPTQI